MRTAIALLMMMLTTMTAWATTETVNYIDADGTQKSVTATVLTGSEEPNKWGEIELARGWYVVKSNISYTNTIANSGSGSGGINIILADGAEMSIIVSSSNAITINNCSLAIYGQSEGTGKLTASTTSEGDAIFVYSDLTINGGIVSATTSTNHCDIRSQSDITINGGQVTANGNGIVASNGHTLILGLRKESDFIQASRYSGTVQIREGLALTDGTTIYSGNDVSIPDNARLTPANFIDNGDDTYTIGSSTGWNHFCDLLVNNTKGYFTNKTVKLGANITVNRMAGIDKKDFTGTFDGQGYTITLDSSNGAYALFRNVENGDIKNLHVTGTINASAKYAAGLISGMWGTVNIDNCHSSVTIKSSVSGDGTHSGFVAANNGTLNITGCLFDGKLLTTGSTTNCCGGFVGYNGATANISNSLYAPAALEEGETEITDNSATFGRNVNSASITNSYYTKTLGTAQGIHAHSITAGESVTVAFAAKPTNTYSTSGLSTYATGTGIAHTPDGGGSATLYASSGDEVSVKLRNTPAVGYTLSAYTVSPDGVTLTEDGDNHTLTMPDADVTIGAVYTLLLGEGNDGTAEHPYVISSVDGWNFFRDRINNGDTNYQGKYYKLDADITVENMVGTSGKPFSGTFDGQGHTLTVNYDNDTSDLWAPFRYVKNATIRNLHVSGTIKITLQFAAGIVAKVVKDGNVSIENCHSSVTIERKSTSSSVFYAYYAGFVARNDNSSLTITGCIFDGTLKAQKSSITRKGCGFVSSNYGTVSITNSLFKPSSIINIKSDHSYTFCPNTDGTVTITNSYYTETIGTAQGTQAYVYTPATDSFVPANVGEPIANGTYSVSGITAYSDGLKQDADFYMVKASVSLADNDDNSTAIIDKQVADVKLSGRTLYKDGNWNTLCLPFDVTKNQRSNITHPLYGATIKKMASTSYLDDNGTLMLNFTDVSSIVAGTPYLIKWETTGSNIKNPVFTDVIISSTEPTPVVSSDSKVTFVGQYSPFAIDETNINSVIMLSSGNRLGYSNATRTLRPFRAHFEVPGDGSEPGARNFVLDFGDETTGVVSIDHSPLTIDHSADAWYSLDGRKLDNVPTKKGVYIVNGRKVVIK